MGKIESINAIIIKTLSFLNIPIEQDLYEGEESKYIVWTIADERGGSYADDIPEVDIISIQISMYLPCSENYIHEKKQIKEALYKRGFTYPKVRSFYEKETKLRHLVFECEYSQMIELESKKED